MNRYYLMDSVANRFYLSFHFEPGDDERAPINAYAWGVAIAKTILEWARGEAILDADEARKRVSHLAYPVMLLDKGTAEQQRLMLSNALRLAHGVIATQARLKNNGRFEIDFNESDDAKRIRLAFDKERFEKLSEVSSVTANIEKCMMELACLAVAAARGYL